MSIAWIEGGSIFIAVFIVSMVGSYNNFKMEKQFFALIAKDDQEN
jgi:hypothetical protein